MKDFKQDRVWFQKGPSSGSVEEGWLEEICEEPFNSPEREGTVAMERPVSPASTWYYNDSFVLQAFTVQQALC